MTMRQRRMCSFPTRIQTSSSSSSLCLSSHCIGIKRKSDSISSATTEHRGKPAKEKVGEAESEELGSFADLPTSVTTHILLQLPINSVSICKCVCRTWNALISDPYFSTLYYEHASLSVMLRTNDSNLVSRSLHLLDIQTEKFDPRFHHYININFNPKFKLPLRRANETYHLPSYKPIDDKFEVLNSCNGLLCLCEPINYPFRSANHLAVCNPITGEFIRLPEATGTENTLSPKYAALGFQPKTNEYKVIRMLGRRYFWGIASNNMVVEIYTLGTTTWKNVEIDPKLSVSMLESPTCVNGALHWINFEGNIETILCFNFESERFQSFPLPPPLPPQKARRYITMVELKGFLYICDSTYSLCEVWLMKKYGIGESWTKVFCTDNFEGSPWGFGVCRPVKHFENGDGALLNQRFYGGWDSFVYYEPEKHRYKYFSVEKARFLQFELIPFIPSLISLKDIVKGNKIMVQNVHSRCAKFEVPEEYESLVIKRKTDGSYFIDLELTYLREQYSIYKQK